MREPDIRLEVQDSHPRRSYVLPALMQIQHKEGYVSDAAIEEIAASLRMTVNAVEAAATSYPEVRRSRPGRFLVRVCAGAPCWANGGAELLASLEERFGVSAGETRDDALVTLETIPCCFVCGLAPVVEINGEPLGRATVALADQLLRQSSMANGD